MNDDWRPMSTARENGESILVRDYYATDWKKHADGRYVQTGRDGLGIVVARFDKSHGWHVAASVVGGLYIKLTNPVGWQPLPPLQAEAPEAPKDGE